MALTRPIHPAPGDNAEGSSRDQVCHPQEESRWPCPDCGGTGCPACSGIGVLPRSTDHDGYIGLTDRRATPAQRDSIDGYHRDVRGSA